MSPSTDASHADRYAAFRHASFKKYWAARFLSAFAVQIVSVAVGWQIYDQTRDAFNLGMVGLVQFLPALVLVLFTGAAADRFGRRLVMGLSLVLEAGVTAFLLLLTLFGDFEPIVVFGALLVFGIARAFLGPSSASLVVNLVPTELIGLAGSNHRRPCCWRPALRHLAYRCLRRSNCVSGCRFCPDFLNSKAKAAHHD
jgi:MFS family permease